MTGAERRIALALLVVTALAYAPGLGNQLVWDALVSWLVPKRRHGDFCCL